MCLIVFAKNYHPDYPFILIANRDEFYERPTAPAEFWESSAHLLAGRDLKAMGTWMGITKSGRFAALTNYRDLENINPEAKSRGHLCTDFLLDARSGVDFLKDVNSQSDQYNGFNLLVMNEDEMHHYSNYEHKINVVDPGVFGLSNALFDTPWPKVTLLKERFKTLIDQEVSHDGLLQLLADDKKAEDEHLPATGVSYEWEKALSSICIKTEQYGTCSSTVLTMDRSGLVKFTEKLYPVGQRIESQNTFEFKLEK
ncbi:MAG: NRDE family protein [Cyclobacteriaceae bacterium]